MSNEGNPHGAATVALLTAMAAIVTDLVQSNSVDPERLKKRLNSWLTSPEALSLSEKDMDMVKMIQNMLVTTITAAEGKE